jgi:hypothetical protein
VFVPYKSIKTEESLLSGQAEICETDFTTEKWARSQAWLTVLTLALVTSPYLAEFKLPKTEFIELGAEGGAKKWYIDDVKNE